jgi:hypothetical protein
MGIRRRVLAEVRRKKREKRNEYIRIGIVVVYTSVMVALIGFALLYKPKSESSVPNATTTSATFTSAPSMYESVEAFNDDGTPAHVYVSGDKWDINRVSLMADAKDAKPGEKIIGGAMAITFCDRQTIEYILTRDPMELRTNLMHEIFHAGACKHGGARWWNSKSDENHPGVYHLGEFMAQFARDNPVFMRWEGGQE